VADSIRTGLVEVAFDPQTSGGLLIALDESTAPALVDRLRGDGVASAAIVGRAVKRERVSVRLD
jgi:selenide,water dikinase